MRGVLYEYFAADYRRLEQLLDKESSVPNVYELSAYERFRAGYALEEYA